MTTSHWGVKELRTSREEDQGRGTLGWAGEGNCRWLLAGGSVLTGQPEEEDSHRPRKTGLPSVTQPALQSL